MGEFSTLKYYTGGLHKEIDYTVTNIQKPVWMKNAELQGESGITIRECDDFRSTILLRNNSAV